MNGTVQERFWAKVVRDPETDCWLWLAATSNGYGRFTAHDHRQEQAHRLAYEMLVGPIPDGLQIDHLCRVRNCVNPAHMEPVSARVNTLRGVGATARKARQTHCVHGHPLDSMTTLRDGSVHRICLTCHRIRNHAMKAARGGKFYDPARCRNGHERTPENTYIQPKTGRRQCRDCWRVLQSRRRAQSCV